MRRLLAHAVARRDARTFAAMAQRLGFVESPDGATLRFLMSVYAESLREPSDVRAACAYGCGAVLSPRGLTEFPAVPRGVWGARWIGRRIIHFCSSSSPAAAWTVESVWAGAFGPEP